MTKNKGKNRNRLTTGPFNKADINVKVTMIKIFKNVKGLRILMNKWKSWFKTIRDEPNINSNMENYYDWD